MFVPGGQISHKVFSTAFSKDEKELIKLFEPFYNEKISKGLAKFGSDLNHLERYFDELIIEIMKSFSFDSFDIGPMIYYFLLKQAEAQNLRIIYATSDIDSLLRY
jgi:vacuolar-type H+-ATPase subunit C/Vma6